MKLLKVEKAILLGLVITISATLVSSFCGFSAQCDDIRGRVLRLHILANSDSAADQQLKLNVRDKILAQSAELFQSAQSKAQAEQSVREKLPEIVKVAQDEVNREGYSYKVGANLVHMYFSTRTYGDITLPAGDYDAVRITIGAAKGHNWWCVLFPSLCLPAAEKRQPSRLSDVLSPNEVGIVNGKNSVVFRFKTVELCQQIRDFLRTHGFKIW